MLKNLYIFLIPILLVSCATRQVDTTPVETLYYNDHVIQQDTTWSGEVIIEGVVLVSRLATLTIEPGTIIRFKKIDRNNDAIGDSEIRVLGRVLADGKSASPILFESAEETPQPMDWSYLLIFASGSKNRLSYCQFRHGFTGLQVHFSTAEVRNSVFEENNEGIRFGRVRLTIENNLFRKNDVGIRFTRMEGPVRIVNNEITQNRLGVFLVPSGQNIQDFFKPDRSGRPWNTGRLLITSNNIHANSQYNLSLGEKQLWDLDVTGNWWGSSNPQIIEQGIFARNMDQELGAALFSPFADQPIPGAGIK